MKRMKGIKRMRVGKILCADKENGGSSSFFLLIPFILFIPSLAHAETKPPTLPSLYIEELTWQEVQAAVNGGYTTVIVPTGGTEQEGPQLVIGTHNAVVRYTAGEIAKGLGNAVVAPVVAYAPSGRVHPAEGHMLFSGTVSLSDATYKLMLEEVIRSLKKHGFRMICLVDNQKGGQVGQFQLAEKLTKEWKSDRVKVLSVTDYFLKNGQEEWNDVNGKVPSPKAHAGHIQTSEMLAVDAGGVRDTLRAVRSERDYKATGAAGDSSQATANYGRKYLGLKVEAAIKQIQNASSNAK